MDSFRNTQVVNLILRKSGDIPDTSMFRMFKENGQVQCFMTVIPVSIGLIHPLLESIRVWMRGKCKSAREKYPTAHALLTKSTGSL